MAFSSGTGGLIMKPAAFAAVPSIGVNVEIFAREWVSALARFLKLLKARMFNHGLFLRLAIVVMACRGKQFFLRPSLSVTIGQCAHVNAVFLGYLADMVASAIKHYVTRIALVFRLFLLGSPSAIARFVIPIWINSVKRGSGWPFSHIFYKRIKRIAPALTYSNSSATVILVTNGPRNNAPDIHKRPSAVESMFAFVLHYHNPNSVVTVNYAY